MSTHKKMTEEDINLIEAITKRVKAIQASKFYGNISMSANVGFALRVCHATVCPLRLADMLVASNTDLAHDINGILKYMDAENEKMTDCFSPRFAQ